MLTTPPNGHNECSEALDLAEPNTATLVCDCYEPGGEERSSSDQADITCEAPDLQVTKVCDEQDLATGVNAITVTLTNPANPRGATLANCRVSDDLVAGDPLDPWADAR